VDSAKIEHIRQELPAVESCVYLNTGTNGPLCRGTADVMKKEAEKEYLEGRYVAELMTLEKDLVMAESRLRTAQNMLDHAEMMAERGYVSGL